VKEHVIDMDQPTVRAWIREMFKEIEISSKVFSKTKSQINRSGEFEVSLHGTLYQLQYGDGLMEMTSRFMI